MDREQLTRPPHKSKGIKSKILNIGLSATMMGAPSVPPAQILTDTSVIRSPLELSSNVDTISKIEIEQKYGVILASEDLATAQANNPQVTEDDLTWTQERLRVIDSILSVTPPYFYEADEKGKLTILITGDQTNISCQCGRNLGTESPKDNEIQFGYQQINPKDPSGLFSNLIHEMTHRAMPFEVVETQDEHSPTGFYRSYDSPWYHELQRLLSSFQSEDELERIKAEVDRVGRLKPEQWTFEDQDIYLTAKKHLRPGLLSIRNTILERNGLPKAETPEAREAFADKRHIYIVSNMDDLSSDEKLEYFRLDLLYGLGYVFEPNFPDEFVAVLGQTYVLGKDFFDKVYSQLFTADEVRRLYSFAKREIFKGREYKNRFNENL